MILNALFIRINKTEAGTLPEWEFTLDGRSILINTYTHGTVQYAIKAENGETYGVDKYTAIHLLSDELTGNEYHPLLVTKNNCVFKRGGVTITISTTDAGDTLNLIASNADTAFAFEVKPCNISEMYYNLRKFSAIANTR